MKKTKEINGLPVIAINGGENLGQIEALVVNPDTKSVEFLLINREKWYQEMRVINYTDVIGIGESALTTQDGNNVKPLSMNDSAIELLNKNTNILNAKVMTNKGEILGSVSEFFIAEDDGKISGYQMAENGSDFITAALILTLGSEMIIIDENAYQKPEEESKNITQPEENKPTLNTTEVEQQKEQDESEKPVKVFEEHQRKYLLGRHTSKDILDEHNNVIVKEGEEITEELVKKVSDAGKYVELTMNSK